MMRDIRGFIRAAHTSRDFIQFHPRPALNVFHRYVTVGSLNKVQLLLLELICVVTQVMPRLDKTTMWHGSLPRSTVIMVCAKELQEIAVIAS